MRPITKPEIPKAFQKKHLKIKFQKADNLEYLTEGNYVCLRSPGRSPVILEKSEIETLFCLPKTERIRYVQDNYNRGQRTSIYKLIELVASNKLDIWELTVNPDLGQPPEQPSPQQPSPQPVIKIQKPKREKKPKQEPVQEAVKPKQEKKPKKAEYTNIEGTNFYYLFDGEILLFRSKASKIPLRLDKTTYCEIIRINEFQLSKYVTEHLDKKLIWLTVKLFRLVRTGKLSFFDVEPPKPAEWVELEINKQVRAALKRERIRIAAKKVV